MKSRRNRIKPAITLKPAETSAAKGSDDLELDADLLAIFGEGDLGSDKMESTPPAAPDAEPTTLPSEKVVAKASDPRLRPQAPLPSELVGTFELTLSGEGGGKFKLALAPEGACVLTKGRFKGPSRYTYEDGQLTATLKMSQGRRAQLKMDLNGHDMDAVRAGEVSVDVKVGGKMTRAKLSDPSASQAQPVDDALTAFAGGMPQIDLKAAPPPGGEDPAAALMDGFGKMLGAVTEALAGGDNAAIQGPADPKMQAIFPTQEELTGQYTVSAQILGKAVDIAVTLNADGTLHAKPLDDGGDEGSGKWTYADGRLSGTMEAKGQQGEISINFQGKTLDELKGGVLAPGHIEVMGMKFPFETVRSET